MRNLILILCCSLFLFTCKKYPEGGFLRQGPKTLITGKQPAWQLKLFQVNDVDSTYKFAGTDSIKNYHSLFMTFFSEKCITKTCYYAQTPLFFYNVSFSNKNRTVFFYNDNDQKKCIYYGNPNICVKNIFCPEKSNTEWQILKLRDKECILSSSQKNNYKIILTR